MFRGFLVEDNVPVRGALVEGLAELAGITTIGYAVDEQSAMDWLTDSGNDWDIAIVDLNLGAGGSGFRVLEALSSRQPHQRVVVWTATADALARTRCRLLRVDRVFDRATDMALLMDYCMEQSEAQVKAATSSVQFPSDIVTAPRGPVFAA